MGESLLDQFFPSTLLGCFAIALGLTFLLVQQRSKATWGLAVAWAAIGLVAMLLPPNADLPATDDIPLSARVGGLALVAASAATNVYISGLLDTAQSSPRARRIVRMALSAGWVMAGVLLVLNIFFARQGLNDYTLALDDEGTLDRPGFWLYASVFIVQGAIYTSIWVTLARQRLDVGERARASALAVAVPILLAASALPYRIAMAAGFLSFVIMLLGLFRYHVAQGERSAFLTRFLSAEVAESVRLEGLDSVMQPGERSVTVVACDLRGFTAYAEAVPSQAVIDLLDEYYDAVGVAVTEVHGTIKDYAGDGVLMLLGAPIARDDHAAAGLLLARRLHEVTAPVLENWSTGPHPLGLGVGVASGRVTVGAVGSTSRLEYTAVGTPVNVAARLCSSAEAGQSLIAQSTAELAGADGLESRGTMTIKGLSTDQIVYAL